MIESPFIAQMLREAEAKAEARAEARGKAEGRLETKIEDLLRVMQKRYRELPEALVAAVRTCTDSAQLDRWLDLALEAETLAQFRQQAGL